MLTLLSSDVCIFEKTNNYTSRRAHGKQAVQQNGPSKFPSNYTTCAKLRSKSDASRSQSVEHFAIEPKSRLYHIGDKTECRVKASKNGLLIFRKVDTSSTSPKESHRCRVGVFLRGALQGGVGLALACASSRAIELSLSLSRALSSPRRIKV